MFENYCCPLGKSVRAVAPARAREIFRSQPETLHTEPVTGPDPESDPVRQARVEELRRQVQNGTYRVDVTTVSADLVDEHIAG